MIPEIEITKINSKEKPEGMLHGMQRYVLHNLINTVAEKNDYNM